MASLRQRVIAWVHQKADAQVENMQLFTTGGMIFAVGMLVILLAERQWSPSVQQELVAAVGVFIAAVGLTRALWGYLGIGLFRILKHLLPDT